MNWYMSQAEADALNEEAARRARIMRKVTARRREELEKMEKKYPRSRMVWVGDHLVFKKSGKRVPTSKSIPKVK